VRVEKRILKNRAARDSRLIDDIFALATVPVWHGPAQPHAG
jgi:hypothetical protein